MSTPTEPTKRFQCRHILTDGHRCGSPALKQEIFCYYHHTSRKPIPKTEAQDRKGRRADFDLPLPEDRSAIQQSIGEVLRRIAGHGIDARRAGLLLYGLQIASLNLPRQATPSEPEEPAAMVEEIVHDPTHGPLALESELPENKEPLSTLDLLLREFAGDETPSTPTVVPSMRACPRKRGRSTVRRSRKQTPRLAFRLTPRPTPRPVQEHDKLDGAPVLGSEPQPTPTTQRLDP